MPPFTKGKHGHGGTDDFENPACGVCLRVRGQPYRLRYHLRESLQPQLPRLPRRALRPGRHPAPTFRRRLHLALPRRPLLARQPGPAGSRHADPPVLPVRGAVRHAAPAGVHERPRAGAGPGGRGGTVHGHPARGDGHRRRFDVPGARRRHERAERGRLLDRRRHARQAGRAGAVGHGAVAVPDHARARGAGAVAPRRRAARPAARMDRPVAGAGAALHRAELLPVSAGAVVLV